MYETIQLGDTGESVKILQEKLKILGYYNGIITGSFGPATLTGVKEFQKSINIKDDGIVNDITWEKLLEQTEPTIAPITIYPTLSQGSTGQFVKDLQIKLKNLLYYTGKINSNFDLETENAVKRLQLNNKLTADGIVGNQTWNTINKLYGNLNACVIDSEEDTGNEDNNEITYTVVSGDTLYSIARRYNTTPDAIKTLNNLNSNILKVGQILKIPTSATNDYIKYTVVSGDTLYSIAKRYNTTPDTIKQLNNLTSNILKIGQILLIPTKVEDNYINYIVQKGDTLYSIALRYNTSIDNIKILNNLSSNNIIIGQVLKIPTTKEDNYINYTVVSGDTLYSIALRYNTTPDAIKKLNNLTSNILRIGQILKIPV